jgi:hypothetical protein
VLDTIMTAVTVHGTPLMEDPDRVDAVTSVGIDETSFLRATGTTGPSSPPGGSTPTPASWPEHLMPVTAGRDRARRERFRMS